MKSVNVSDKEIANIAALILGAQKDGDAGRVTYLRILIQAAQATLEGRKGLDEKVQLSALAAVHERFYAIVLDAAQPFVPKTQKDRAVELHRRVNFARTAVSALRGHVRAGGDLVALNPAKTTKRNLKSREGPPRPVSAKRWRARAESQSKALIATILGLADADKAAAVEEIQLVLGQLTTQLVSLGVISTKDALQSVGEHRPLRIGKTLFVPTNSQVVRQQARPS